MWADPVAKGNLFINKTGPAGWNPWGTGEPSRLIDRDCGAVGASGDSSAWRDSLCSDKLPFLCVDEGKPLDTLRVPAAALSAGITGVQINFDCATRHR